MAGKITIGPLKIPRLEIEAGSLLDVELPWPLPHLKVPPLSFTLLPEITLLPELTVFDPEWILDFLMEKAEWLSEAVAGVVDGLMEGIIQTVFNAVEPYLDKMAGEYYERHPKE